MKNQENADEQSTSDKEKGQDKFLSLKPDMRDGGKNPSEGTGEQLTGGNQIPEIATNDGSVVETLDTAFHGTPGWSEGENISGSNRADYYEARSYGKSDSEEELDEMRKRNKDELPKNKAK